MYTRSVTLRRACVVKKSVRVGCGKKGFEPSFFFEEKSWKIRAKETADLSRFLSSINCPYILRKKRGGERRVSKPCCPRRVAVNSQYPMI